MAGGRRPGVRVTSRAVRREGLAAYETRPDPRIGGQDGDADESARAHGRRVYRRMND